MMMMMTTQVYSVSVVECKIKKEEARGFSIIYIEAKEQPRPLFTLSTQAELPVCFKLPTHQLHQNKEACAELTQHVLSV